MSRNAFNRTCIVGVALSLSLVACSKKQANPNLSDSERIRQSAQAVLDAKRTAVPEAERENGRDSIRKLQQGVDQYRTNLLSILAPSAQVVNVGKESSNNVVMSRSDRGTRSADAALNQLIGQIDDLSASYGSRAAAPKAGSTEWQTQFTAAGLSRLAALKTELEGWRGKPVLEQLDLASKLQERINIRQAARGRPGTDTPTLSVETSHR